MIFHASRNLALAGILIVTLILHSAPAKAEGGFRKIPGPNNPFPGEVAISSPPNCTRETTLYGNELGAKLKAMGIPVRLISQVQFKFDDAEEAKDLQTVMAEEPLPQVIINGRIMGHPTLNDILYELQLQNYQYYQSQHPQ